MDLTCLKGQAEVPTVEIETDFLMARPGELGNDGQKIFAREVRQFVEVGKRLAVRSKYGNGKRASSGSSFGSRATSGCSS